MHSELCRKRIFILGILFLLLFDSCEKKEDFPDDNFTGTKVIILGHQGMGAGYWMPGNTLQAIIPAICIGADGCEVDVQLTKDTVLVLYHDARLDSKTRCTGRIYESNWAEIQQCEYTGVQTGVYINSIDSLFKKIPDLNNLYFSFDCMKEDLLAADRDLYQAQYLRALKRLCEKYGMSDNVFIEGSEVLLNKAQMLGLTNKLFLFGYLDENSIDVATNNHYFGISTSPDWMLVGTEKAHERELYVMAWSPNNYSQNKRLLYDKVDIIQTDDPISILKLLNRYNYEYLIP